MDLLHPLVHAIGCRISSSIAPKNRHDTHRLDVSCLQSLNYTRLGYAKQKLPEALFEEIRAFWKAHHMTETVEAWNAGNTFTNHWAAPSALVSLEVRLDHLSALRWDHPIFPYFSVQISAAQGPKH
jgi:hypothetical protein